MVERIPAPLPYGRQAAPLFHPSNHPNTRLPNEFHSDIPAKVHTDVPAHLDATKAALAPYLLSYSQKQAARCPGGLRRPEPALPRQHLPQVRHDQALALLNRPKNARFRAF